MSATNVTTPVALRRDLVSPGESNIAVLVVLRARGPEKPQLLVTEGFKGGVTANLVVGKKNVLPADVAKASNAYICRCPSFKKSAFTKWH